MALVPGLREAKQAELAADPWLAHTFFFPHRHTEDSSPAHHAVVMTLHGTNARDSIQAFRGFGKSTLTEESIVIQGVYRRFRNKLIVGASYDRACERLASIKREIEHNERLIEFFGPMRGQVWQEGKITLKGGICIQALGRDQSLRGTKHLDWRPDSALVDDVEDKDEVRSPAGRQKTRDWFLKEFLPALDDPVLSKVTVLGTPMDPESLVVELQKMGWPTTKFPIESIDDAGARRPTWPGKFPLWKIDAMRKDYARDMTGFQQEYMLEPVSDADRVFTPDMIRVQPRERGWHAVYAMIDPARTTNRQSATTGWAVWSWIGRHLHVWASGAESYMPDQIIDLMFTIDEKFNPVWESIEEDGLNEWLNQPIRHEQVKRRRVIPYRPQRAPRDKDNFIKSLQPFYKAGEITHQAYMKELEEQLSSFPTGKKDAPNALAFAVLSRPDPIYDGFSPDEVIADIEPDPTRPLYLAGNATRSMVTAVLCQFFDDAIHVYRDWVCEGEPNDAVASIHAEAGMEGDAAAVSEKPRYDWIEALKLPAQRFVMKRQAPRWVAPATHMDAWNNVGLMQAVRLLPGTVQRGGGLDAGRAAIRARLDRRGQRGVAISERAAWTLRAFTGGYTRLVRKGGGVTDEAEPGVYRLLMEGLEAFVGMTVALREDEGDDAQPVSYNRQGQAYKSAMPQRMR